MAFEDIMIRLVQLQVSTDALAAIGATATTKLSGAPLDPDVADALAQLLAALGIEGVDELEPPQLAIVAGVVRTAFLQASDLLQRPERAPGWQYTDPHLLQGQG